jgi:hypothetical protein
MEKTVWGIDPGSSICGVCELRSGLIGNVFNEEPNKVFNRIMSICGSHRTNIVIEDVFPYSNRLTPEIIDTCKLIGELTYRFNTTDNVSLHLVSRSSVRNWIFKTVPDVVVPRIIARMEYLDKQKIKQGKKGLRDKEGKLYEPHFKYVDDRIVIAALKSIYNIPTPKPGKSNIFGLKDHSWQALAVTAYFVHIGKKS